MLMIGIIYHQTQCMYKHIQQTLCVAWFHITLNRVVDELTGFDESIKMGIAQSRTSNGELINKSSICWHWSTEKIIRNSHQKNRDTVDPQSGHVWPALLGLYSPARFPRMAFGKSSLQMVPGQLLHRCSMDGASRCLPDRATRFSRT